MVLPHKYFIVHFFHQEMATSPLRNRPAAPRFISHLCSLRVGNLPTNYEDKELLRDFQRFGVVGDLYRPIDTRNGNAKPIPFAFAFVRYFSEEDASNARAHMDGKEIHGNYITVDYAEHHSRFSNSTGYITNYDITEPPRTTPDFDPSMPASHREKKVEEWASQVDEVYTLKVEGLNTDISVERLREIFSTYGFISTIYYPVDLKTLRTRNFALIRYIEEKDAREAQRQTDGQDLGSGPLSVYFWEQQRYFNKTPFVTIKKPAHVFGEGNKNYRQAVRFDL